MDLEELDIFVPGRLCLIGEHSDWASNYKKVNKEINDGFAITVLLNDGISAKVRKSNKIIVNFLNQKNIEQKCKLEEINKTIKGNNFWKYIFGAIKYMVKTYKVSGIDINIKDVTLPMKKGLGSSAAISLLVVKSYNKLYDLGLSEEKEIEAAYYSEVGIGSKCGKLDQISKINEQVKLLHFDNNDGKEKLTTEKIDIKDDIFMVYVDLKGSKDTVKILDDLNKCYPYYKNESEKKVHEFLGKENEEMVFKARKYIEYGEIKELGKLLTDYQNLFDEYLMPHSTELIAPLLHKLLNDEIVKKLTYGGKGCGSGGDGSAQFIAKDEKCQKDLIKYLTEQLELDARSLVIRSSKIKKAIIPVGGFATRMYPISKVIGKEFLPILDVDGKIKPAILILLTELINSGIEQIGLVLPRKYQKAYKNFFNRNNDYNMFDIEEEKLQNIFSKLVFIDDEEQKGLSNVIMLSKDFIGKENFMLVLGDQIYKSNTYLSCTNQLLDFYSIKKRPIISVVETPLEYTNNYGILKGDKIIDNNYFKIVDFKEKPQQSIAKNLYTIKDGKKEYYSIFGSYIFDNKIFELIKDEKQFSDILEKYITKYKPLAFIPNGKYYDIGNNRSYYETFIKFSGGFDEKS